MSWEALRLTSRSPAELMAVLGPHGVDDLVRQALNTLWREHPQETRSVQAVAADAQAVFDRNMKVWKAIKKPTPEAFFANLLPHAADGFFRQALVLTWMMMPRTGGRKFADVAKIVTHIYQRNLAAWEEDLGTFTGKRPRKTAKAGKARTGKRPR